MCSILLTYSANEESLSVNHSFPFRTQLMQEMKNKTNKRMKSATNQREKRILFNTLKQYGFNVVPLERCCVCGDGTATIGCIMKSNFSTLREQINLIFICVPKKYNKSKDGRRNQKQ